MNINLVYEGKEYNFDIPNDVTVDYIRELSSKIFDSDKAILDLVYNNQIVEDKNGTLLIKDLIPKGKTTAVLTVQVNKKNLKNNKNEIFPLVNLKDRNEVNNSNNTSNEKEKDKEKENNKSVVKEKNKNDNPKKYEKKLINFLYNGKSRNKIDHSKFMNANSKVTDIKQCTYSFVEKSKELFETIKEFNNKVKEIYTTLYQKYKNSGTPDNISSFSNSSSILGI